MIGTNLGLSLPLLSDTLATIVSKTNVALTAIQTSIADRATPAGLNITTALSFGSQWATNVGGLVLVTGNPPSAAGSVYYSAGEFYMVDHTGAIQMTLNGAINVSGFGGIGGDYGGSNPALLYYDTASGQYRFYTNGGTHAFGDTESRAAILNNGTGSVKLSADASVTTTKSYPIGNFTANKALIWDGSKIRTAVSTTAVVSIYQSVLLDFDGRIAFTDTGGYAITVAAGGTGILTRYPLQLPVGAVITGYTMYWKKDSDAATTVLSQLLGVDGITGGGIYTSAGTGTEANSANAPSYVTTSITGITQTVVAGSQWFIVPRKGAATANDRLYSVEVTYVENPT